MIKLSQLRSLFRISISISYLIILGYFVKPLDAQDAGQFDGIMPKLSPDGKMITFVSNRNGKRDLWLMNADGTIPVNVTTAIKDVYAFFPEWSPDSHYILFLSSDLTTNNNLSDLWLVSLDNRKLQRLITAFPVVNPKWSPDGKLIAFGRYENLDNISIWLMDSDGKNMRQLISGDRNTSPQWSHDGKSITYISSKGSQTQLSLTEIETGKTRTLSTNNVLDYTWAPRSNLIAYITTGNLGELMYDNIWLVQTDTASEFKLTNKPIFFVNELAWSPDEMRLLFWSPCENSVTVTDIWILDLQQLSTVNLTSCQQSFNSSTSWFLDSEHILFRSNRSGNPSIWVMTSDGSNAVDLINPIQ